MAVHADDDKIDGQGNLKPEELDLLVYITGSCWKLGKRLGNMGFTRK